jgi:hypothetical protein
MVILLKIGFPTFGGLKEVQCSLHHKFFPEFSFTFFIEVFRLLGGGN